MRPLRAAVLRPGLPPAASVYPQDDRPDTLHLAAYDRTGAVVGCATVFPEPLDGVPGWRLRGMATASAVRSRGVGSALLERTFAELAARSAPMLWCNARTPAVAFYRRAGFETVGEQFDSAPAGPHYRMIRRLAG